MTAFWQSEAFILSVAGAIFSGVYALFWFAVKRYFVTQADYDADQEISRSNAAKLNECINQTATRVNALETRVNALPTAAMLHRVDLRLETLGGEQKAQAAQLTAMRGSLDGINNSLALIQQYLMENH